MRQFSILYGGYEYSLSSAQSPVFLENPSGLGAAFELSMHSPADGFFKSARQKTVQMPIVGTLAFKGNGENYETYREYLPMLLQSEIDFKYAPYDPQSQYTSFQRLVKLENISKGEKRGDWLYCPVSFLPLTPWYIQHQVTLTREIGGHVLSAALTVTGDMGAAISIEHSGFPLPTMIQLGDAVSAEVYSQLYIPAANRISGNGTLRYSTEPRDSYASFTAAGTEYDLVERAELETAGFPLFGLLPQTEGETADKIINVVYPADVTAPGNMTVDVREYWRSV